MNKLSNTEAELKKSLAYKKKPVLPISAEETIYAFLENFLSVQPLSPLTQLKFELMLLNLVLNKKPFFFI